VRLIVAPWLLLLTHPFVALALVFLIDGLGLPLLPEVAAIVAFGVHPTLAWGATLLAVITIMEVTSAALLYALVARFGRAAWLQRLLARYTRALLLGDERLLLLNRIVPVLPAAGAFICINRWPVRRSFLYVAAGSAAKYGLILLVSGAAYTFFAGPIAFWLTLGLAAAFLLASLAYSLRHHLAPAVLLALAKRAWSRVRHDYDALLPRAWATTAILLGLLGLGLLALAAIDPRQAAHAAFRLADDPFHELREWGLARDSIAPTEGAALALAAILLLSATPLVRGAVTRAADRWDPARKTA
jgi:hypothetical protein